VSPSNFSLRLPIGEMFSREATITRGAWNAALTGGFNHRLLNNLFYALGHVELWKRSQKIVGNFRRVWRYQTSQVVRVMPDFKAVVFVEGQLPFTVATPPRRKIGLGRAVLGHVFHIMSWVEKFIQHCLGLVRLFTIVFNEFFSTGRVAGIAETTAL
jgi:hypothetical protein